LEKRVLRNEGGHPFDLVNAITGLESKNDDWNCLKFAGMTIDPNQFGMQVIGLCKKYGPGLVLNFFITKHFREAAREKKTGMGY
jgi:hypothetical protein